MEIPREIAMEPWIPVDFPSSTAKAGASARPDHLQRHHPRGREGWTVADFRGTLGADAR
jgi:hypothetical protein